MIHRGIFSIGKPWKLYGPAWNFISPHPKCDHSCGTGSLGCLVTSSEIGQWQTVYALAQFKLDKLQKFASETDRMDH